MTAPPGIAPPPPRDGPGRGAIDRVRRRWGRLPGNVRGGLWALAACAFYAGMMALIKAAGQTLHVTEVLLFRQVFMMLVAMPVILRVGLAEAVRTERPGLQVVRIVVAFGAMLFGFTAVIHLPLADAITIGFARTFFIGVFAILLLGEIVGARRWGAMAVGFAGVLIVAQPEGWGSFSVHGLMAIAGAACAGLVMVVIRILARTDRPVTILAYQAVGIGVLVLPAAIWFWKTPTPAELLILMGVGVVSALSQTCNILAFRAAEASAIAPLDYVRLVFAVLLGLLVFGEWPTWQVLAGAAVIVGAGLYTLERERRLAKVRRPAGRPPSEKDTLAGGL